MILAGVVPLHADGVRSALGSFEVFNVEVTRAGAPSFAQEDLGRHSAITSPPGELLPASKTPGHVVGTLVLSNDTLVSGNFRARSGGSPVSIAYDGRAGSLDVLGLYTGTVSVVNATSRAITRIIPVGLIPFNATLAPPTRTLYVSLESFSGNGTVVALNDSTGAVVKTIRLPAQNQPFGMAYDTRNQDLYVSVANSTQVTTRYVLTVISARTNKIVAEIPGAGGLYGGVAYDPTNHDLYSLNESYDSIEVVNGSSNQLLASVSTPCGSEDGGGAVAYDPKDRDVFIVSYQNNEACILSASNNSLVAVLPLVPGPSGNGPTALGSIAVDPRNDYVYVPNEGTGIVTEINGANDQVLGPIPAGIQPSSALYDDQNNRLYVANVGSSNLTIWDPSSSSTAGAITLGDLAGWGSVDTTTGTVFLSADAPDDLIAVNSTSSMISASVSLPGEDDASAYDTANGRLYVLEENPSTSVGTLIGTNSTTLAVETMATLGSVPEAVAYDTANGDLYATNFASNNVSVVNGATGSVVGKVSFPASEDELPVGIAYDPKSGYVVADVFTNGEAVCDIDGATNAIVKNKTLAFFPEPGLITVDASNGNLYIGGEANDARSLLTGSVIGVVGAKNLTQFATIPSPAVPYGGAFDPRNGYIYVATEVSDSVAVVNPSDNRIVANISVGSLPTDVVYDPVTGDLYVTNVGSGTISIISTAT